MAQRARILGAVALVAVFAVAAAWWLQHRQVDDNRLVLQGNVDIRQVSLAFTESERILEMRVEEGARVKAGDVLAVLDTRTLALQVAQAQAQMEAQEQSLNRLKNGNRPEEIAQARARLAAAQADARLADQDLQRVNGLAADTQGAGVSAQDRDRAAAQARSAHAREAEAAESLRLALLGPRKEDIAQANAQWQAAKQSWALLQHRMTLAQLRAPSDAVVRSRLAEPGDMASPQRAVYALALVEPKWIRAYVNELQLARIQPGMAATVHIDGRPGEALKGTLGFISSVAEFTPKNVQTEELRTSLVYEVRIRVADPRDHLRLGMPATVQLELGLSGSQPMAKGVTERGA